MLKKSRWWIWSVVTAGVKFFQRFSFPAIVSPHNTLRSNVQTFPSKLNIFIQDSMFCKLFLQTLPLTIICSSWFVFLLFISLLHASFENICLKATLFMSLFCLQLFIFWDIWAYFVNVCLICHCLCYYSTTKLFQIFPVVIGNLVLFSVCCVGMF